MKNPQQHSTLALTDAVLFEPDAAQRTASGIWSLEDDRLTSIESVDSGPAVVLVRSEHVLVMTVQLPPIAGTAKRRAALPFAIEDRIAEPLDAVHIALGREIQPKTFLVGVVRHELMREWVLRLVDAGLERAIVVPDALSLPVPGPGAWSVDLAGERALVRAADGTGFAMPLALLSAAWTSAGEPACIAYGDPLPPQMAAPNVDLEVSPLAQRLIDPALDLRQGPYAAPRRPVDPIWRRMTAVAALGALAHGAIAVAGTLALQSTADRREEEVRALAATLQPGLVLGPDLGVTVAEMAPDGAVGGQGLFLPLLARTGSAFGALPSPVVWQAANFDKTTGTLTVTVEAADTAAMQAAGQALTGAGLEARPSGSNSVQGRMVGTFAVRAR